LNGGPIGDLEDRVFRRTKKGELEGGVEVEDGDEGNHEGEQDDIGFVGGEDVDDSSEAFVHFHL